MRACPQREPLRRHEHRPRPAWRVQRAASDRRGFEGARAPPTQRRDTGDRHQRSAPAAKPSLAAFPLPRTPDTQSRPPRLLLIVDCY